MLHRLRHTTGGGLSGDTTDTHMSQWGNDPQISAGMIGDSEEDRDPLDDLTLSTTAATRVSCEIAEPQQRSNPPACDRSLLPTRARFHHSIDALGQGSGDPFGSLPGLVEGDIDFLVHHYSSVFIRTCTPPGPRKRWLPLAITDSALFHATLHISASHVAALKNSRPSPALFYHRGEAIREINSRLLCPDLAATDGTIGAVACLLINDSLSGHPERVVAHLAGLQQLISARGGVSQLNPLIQRIVGWVDLLGSIILLKRPLYTSVRFGNSYPQPFDLVFGPPSLSTLSHAADLSARLFRFTRKREASDSAGRILWGLRSLSILKEMTDIYESDNLASFTYSDRLEVLEREVQMLFHHSLEHGYHTLREGALNPSVIFIILAHATILYICYALRDLCPNRLCDTIVGRLEFAMDIDDSDLNILIGTFPDMMLWALFTGGGGARKKNSKIWFAKTASRLLRIRKLEDETNIKAAAAAFIWPEGRENYDDSTVEDAETDDIVPPEIANEVASIPGLKSILPV